MRSCRGTGASTPSNIKFLEAEASPLGISLFDLLSDFRSLSAQAVFSMYIPPESKLSPNHLNEARNAFVARAIYERLKAYLAT